MRPIIKRLLFIIVTLFYSSFVFSQGQVVTGVVTDKETSESIPGVNIVIQGTTTGVITDLDGNFKIEINDPSAVLAFSSIGYLTEVVTVGEQTEINVGLIPDIQSLDEVVVVGYGTQRKKVVTGAIASLDANDITSTSVLRVDQAMQGRTAGVQVINLSGQPGEEPSVRIRGIGSTKDANPLYIVDGMPVAGIDYLNPGDIESMDVLKDAASAAIYGARAANGVVLITTKSGKKGKTNITYSGYGAVQNVVKKLDVLNADEYRMLMNEGARNAGLTEPFDLNEIPRNNTNWQNEVFEKNAPMQSHELSVTGGNEKSTFASSVSYFSQEGIIGGEKSKFDRYTARLNSRSKVTDKFTFSNNLAYSHMVKRGIGSNESFNGVYSSALNLDPLTPVFETDTALLNQYPYNSEPVVTTPDGKVYGISDYVGAEVVNPLALLETQTKEDRLDKLVGNIKGELEIIEGLKLTTSLGADLFYTIIDSYKPLYYLNGAQLNVDKTSVNKEIQRLFKWQWENTINYSKKIGEHNFSVLLGVSAEKTNWENLTGSNAKVPINDPDNVYLSMATDTTWKADGGASHSSLYSNFGRITYDYKDRYAFTAIVRRDGSSRFGENNKYGIFPSVGFSWVLSDEPFIPELKNVSFIKLRTSWGINGNENIGDYNFVSLMDKSRGYIFGGGRVIGVSPQYMENQDIKWEESRQFNAAIDFGAFNNQLTVTADYYIKVTKDLLDIIPIPGHVGNGSSFSNVGTITNKGIELSINWKQYVNSVLSYSIGVNGAYNKNEMTEIANEEKVLTGASWALAGPVTRSEEGLPMANFYGYVTDGIFQEEGDVFRHVGKTGNVLQPNAVPGDVRFVDVNNDGKLDADDRTVIGNPLPDATFGVNGAVNFKQFDLSFLLVGSIGNEVFNGSQRMDLQYFNKTTALLERWTLDNPSNTTPRYTWSDVNNNYRVSDLYVENGSFMRVKNLQIGYSIPASIMEKIHGSNWRFYISVDNLLTFTKYTGADPEIGIKSGSTAVKIEDRNSFDMGIDRGVYPQPRILRFGTSITF
jgi:TonB-dependent starch-binding outer membrane protein SusC